MMAARAGVRPFRPRVALAACLVVTGLAAALGSLGSATAPAIYPTFRKPEWAPPGWVFGPVWTVLYVAMAVAAFLVVRRRGWVGSRLEMGLYLLQLAANALWSWYFFAWRNGRGAFIEVLVLWTLVAATLVAFFRVSRAAGLLLLPYLAWVGFAAWLTWEVWRANPGRL